MQPEKSKNSRNAEGKNLTAQQTKILAHIAVGAADEEIAEKLRISPHDVKTDIDDILAKIQARNRLQAALWAATNL